MKVLEEHNYTSELNDRVFELSSSVSVGLTLHVDEENNSRNPSVMEVEHTRRKLFIF